MKLEVINPSTEKAIKTYSVPDLSMFDFQEWKDESEVVIQFNCLYDTVSNLNSSDMETNKPISVASRVEFYLPDPIKNRVFSRLANSQMDSEESSNQPTEMLEEVTERVSTPELKSSAALSAVAMEILQNHHERSNYKVRISDG